MITLYSIGLQELNRSTTPYELNKQIEQFLIYGSYPEVVTLKDIDEKENRITEIKNSYLIKDILEFQKLKRPQVILDLLKLIAFQIGNQVSTVEFGKQLGIDKKTVESLTVFLKILSAFYSDILFLSIIIHRTKTLFSLQHRQI